MVRILLGLCLSVLAGGCAKKPRPATEPDADPTSPARADASPPAVPTVPAPPARPALPKEWIEFQHPSGAYTVFLPVAPMPLKLTGEDDLSRPVPAGRALASNCASQIQGLRVELTAVVFSPELVDGVRSADDRRRIDGVNGKRTSVTWGGHTAVEDTSERADNGWLTVSRRMWVGNRAYYVNVYGQAPGRPTAAERAAVFDSFAVGK